MGQDQTQLTDIDIQSYFNIAIPHVESLIQNTNCKLLPQKELQNLVKDQNNLLNKQKIKEHVKNLNVIYALQELQTRLKYLKNHLDDLLQNQLTDQEKRYINTLIKGLTNYSIKPNELIAYLSRFKSDVEDIELDQQLDGAVQEEKLNEFIRKIADTTKNEPKKVDNVAIIDDSDMEEAN